MSHDQPDAGDRPSSWPVVGPSSSEEAEEMRVAWKQNRLRRSAGRVRSAGRHRQQAALLGQAAGTRVLDLLAISLLRADLCGHVVAYALRPSAQCEAGAGSSSNGERSSHVGVMDVSIIGPATRACGGERAVGHSSAAGLRRAKGSEGRHGPGCAWASSASGTWVRSTHGSCRAWRMWILSVWPAPTPCRPGSGGGTARGRLPITTALILFV